MPTLGAARSQKTHTIYRDTDIWQLEIVQIIGMSGDLYTVSNKTKTLNSCP